MSTPFLLGLAGLLTLLPAVLLPLRGSASAPAGERQTGQGSGAAPDRVFWLLMIAATLGPLAFALARLHGGWHTGFGATLWATVAATMIVFLITAAVTRQGWRLATLLMPYLLLVGLLGTIWAAAPDNPISSHVPAPWLAIHIAVALATYALLTLGAVAGLAVWLKERAIRSRRPDGWTTDLPPVADTERLLQRLLAFAEIVLGLGLVTGMASQIYATGQLLQVDHKTLLSLAAFVAIGVLLLAHYRFGIRGQRAARIVLLAWLLLTLAYPGVKFVSDILLG